MGDNKDKPNNFQSFIQLQRNIMESIAIDEVDSIGDSDRIFSTVTIDELFKFMEEHFQEFHEFTNLNSIMPFVHRCLKVWLQSEDVFNHDIGNALLHFLEQHSGDENDLAIVIQIVHHILYTLTLDGLSSSIRRTLNMQNKCKGNKMCHSGLNGFADNKQIKVAKKVFVKIAELLTTIKNRKLVSNIIACLQLYIKMYPDIRQEILQLIWTNLSKRLMDTSCIQSINTEIDVLIQLFDEFHEINPDIQDDPKIVAAIQQLLQSEEKNERKYGYFLFKKMLHYLVLKLKKLCVVWLTTYNSQNVEQLWISYILILESLDKKESHLILPSLEHLTELIQSKQLQKSWLEILYTKLLRHKNIDVMYWAMQFFLETFKYSDLSERIVKELLKTSNTIFLYNHEGYFLKQELFSEFLKGNLTKFYDMLVEIDWESIPFYVWIKALSDSQGNLTETSITYEQIIKIASKVFAVKNSLIRKNTIGLVNSLFKETIDKMSMSEYVTYIETLYNTTDYYTEIETFYKKKISMIEGDKEEFIFKQHFYVILLKSLCLYRSGVNKFITFLNDIPQKQHGWLRFIPFHFLNKINDESFEVINNSYGMDLKYLQSCQLTEIISKFENYLKPESLPCKDKQESIEHCRLAAIAFYIQQKKTLDDEDDETLDIIFKSEASKYNLKTVFSNLWEKLCICLENTTKTLNTSIIDEFLKHSNWRVNSILIYISNTYDNDTKNEYYKTILEKYPFDFHHCFLQYVNPLKLSNQKRFFNGELKKDELRIEQLFCLNSFGRFLETPNYFLNSIWIKGIKRYCDDEYILYLLKCHKELTVKYPNYDENSNEYHIKLRIAIAILYAKNNVEYNNSICDEIWNILLNENNQLIICYIYEYILGLYDKRANIILEHLKVSHSLTSAQQISIMSVTYTFCMENEIENTATIEEVISNLHALTMCDNSETQLFAKLFLYKLLKFKKFEHLLNKKDILKSIEIGMQTKLNEYFSDIRLYIYEEKDLNIIIGTLVFITNTSFSEDVSYYKYWWINDERNIKSRNLYLNQNNKTLATKSQTCANDQLELYKISKQFDNIESNNLIIYPERENSTCKIFIVASLIDNISTLSALARNCKILGMTNLIINSKNLFNQEDVLKNLNESVEKTLNIIDIPAKDLKEFLINKQQFENYKIVGSEEVSNFEEITNFKFPQKCILLLGHEKHGLPIYLSSFLDHAFKVSQLNKVHTLNVQETGVFCMWKYYEQHLTNKT